MTPTALLLKMHYKLGHLPFSKLKIMAANGNLDRRIADCHIPTCATCSFGKATKMPWQMKVPISSLGSHLITAPGLCVSVDQLESPIPGLLAHMKGLPTKQRYSASTIFVDHYSWQGYVHLQESLTANNTLWAKEAFKRYCEPFGMKVRQYHADNGWFAENLFVEDIKRQGQTIAYCGVNAHFQNGIAEKRIGDLQDAAPTMMLHASVCWPRNVPSPMAIRIENGKQRLKCVSHTKRWKVGGPRIFGCGRQIIPLAFPSTGLSGLCATQLATGWTTDFKMAQPCARGAIPGTSPGTCTICGPGTQLGHWPRIPTVSRKVRRVLQNRKQAGWQLPQSVESFNPLWERGSCNWWLKPSTPLWLYSWTFCRIGFSSFAFSRRTFSEMEARTFTRSKSISIPWL